jgi:ParB family chromosome partitioning protein
MQIEVVTRQIDEIIPDPDQPRKAFNEEDIQLLAETFKVQGIINPIEIDEHNMIITGEMRWRAAKVAGMTEIECKQITGLSEVEKRERQIIENEHLHRLTNIERENAVSNLFSIENCSQTDLGKKLGISQSRISHLLTAKILRENLDLKLESNISTDTLVRISRLDESDQKQIIAQMKSGKVVPSKVQDYVQTIKKLPDDLKQEVLKIDSAITPELALSIAEFSAIEERKQIIARLTDSNPEKRPADMIGFIKKLQAIEQPDLRAEVLKDDSQITPEIATTISEFQDEEERKQIIAYLTDPEVQEKPEDLVAFVKGLHEIKPDIWGEVLKAENPLEIKSAKVISEFSTEEARKEMVSMIQRDQKNIQKAIEYTKSIDEGTVSPPITTVKNLDEQVLKIYQRAYLRMRNTMVYDTLKNFSPKTVSECCKFLQQMRDHCDEQLRKFQKIGKEMEKKMLPVGGKVIDVEPE